MIVARYLILFLELAQVYFFLIYSRSLVWSSGGSSEGVVYIKERNKRSKKKPGAKQI